MVELTLSPTVDPTPVYRVRDGLYAADLLACAVIYLDLFSLIGDREVTAEELCGELKIAPRPTDVMLTLFVAMGLLAREGEAVRLTPIAREQLVKSSPFYLGPYYASLKDRPVCKDYLDVLRTDKPANWGSFKSEKDWASAMQDKAFAQSFTAAMDCRGVYLAQAAAKKLDLAGHERLLDVAGGSGIYACSFVAHHPALRATVFERTPVDEVARGAIAKRGFAGLVDVMPGDFFREGLPHGYDVHLISNVLHDWNAQGVTELLKKSSDALPPGGLLIIHDVHLNAEKTGPYPNAAYSALLMHSTEGKCYSVSELYPLLERAAFQNCRLIETGADRSVILATRK